MPLVIEEGCGFRPGRKSGLRLEAGEIKVSPSSDKTIPVVYNYGCVEQLSPYYCFERLTCRRRHAGAGYLCSFGTARVAVDLVKAALKD